MNEKRANAWRLYRVRVISAWLGRRLRSRIKIILIGSNVVEHLSKYSVVLDKRHKVLDRIAKAADLTQFMGEPQRIVKSTDGSELWEYHKVNDMVVPKGESTSFFGGGNNYGLSGAFSSEKRPEDRTRSVEHIARFKIF